MRHLDASRAGASVVLDARYIAGSDGDLLPSWTDRTGNGYTPTATTTQRPTLKLAQTGGQRVVRFNGTANVMIAAADLYVDSHTMIHLVKSASSATAQTYVRKGYSTAVSLAWGSRRNSTTQSNAAVGASSTAAAALASISGDAYHIHTSRYDKANISVSISGGAESSTAFTQTVNSTSFRFTVGGSPNHETTPPTIFNLFLNGDIGQSLIFPYSLSPFMRKRFEHAAARSFGVACA